MRWALLWRIHLHLAAFAQLGVLTRLVVGRLFSGPCSGNGRWSWAPCVTGSGLMEIGDTLFYDFPANILGTFFIGLFSTGANIDKIYSRQSIGRDVSHLQLLFLPATSQLQRHAELHLGLRTGYCGSLTTFSSWFLQVVTLMVGQPMPPATYSGTHWVQALWVIYLGMSGPLIALIVGQHTAVAAASAWRAFAQWRSGGLEPSANPARDEGGKGSNGADPSRPVDGPAPPAARTATAAPPDGGAPPAASLRASSCPAPEVVLEVVRGDLRVASAATEPGAAGAPASPAGVSVGVGVGVSIPSAITPSSPVPAAALSGGGLSGALARHAELLTDVAVGAVLLTLTGVSLSYAYLDRDNPAAASGRQFWWFSILLGPLGCFARWYLSHLNGVRDGWLQYGTFAANILGCALVYVCQVLQLRLAGSLTHAQRLALQGLMVGTAGCLTTVSTYMVEIQKLALGSPAGAYKYFLTSTLVAVALGLLVYGIPAWLAA